MFVKLEGRPVLVVGAGRVAESKIRGLVETGARIHVVALQATEQVREWARSGQIMLDERAFSPADLDGVLLVVVATSSTVVNESVFRQAQRVESCATWWMFRSCAIFSIRQWFAAATFRSRSQPPGRVRRWRKSYGSSWSGSSGRGMQPGSRNSARPGVRCCAAASIRNANDHLLHSLASREAAEAAISELTGPKEELA